MGQSSFYDNLTPSQKAELDRHYQEKYQHNPDFQMCRWLMNEINTPEMTEYHVEFVFNGRCHANGKEINDIRIGRVAKARSKK